MATAYGKATKGTGAEIPQIEDDLYLAQVKDVEDGTGKWEGSEYPQYVVEFEILEAKKPNGDYITMRAYIRIPDGVINDGILNENSKLYEFLMALGYDDENLEIDPGTWVGQQLRVNVENKEIKSGDNKGQVRPRITGFKPPKGRGPAAAAAKREAREPVAAGARAKGDDDDF